MSHNRFTSSAIVTLGLALAVVGCATTEAVQSTESSTAASSTPASAPLPSSSSTAATDRAEAADMESECLGEMRVGIISSGWDLVIASHGAPDHFDMTEGFYESIQGASDSNEISVGRCRGSVELAELQFEVAVPKAHILAEGVADSDIYDDVVSAGNAWLGSIERDDYELSMR